MTEHAESPETPAAVLALARDRRGVADRAEAELLQAAVAWASMHSVDSIADAAVISERGWGDTGITVAGPGAPLIGEFSCAEFAAAIGLPTETGKAYLGEAVELRYRLTKSWRRLLGGDLPAWKARRIAAATIVLTPEAAAYVDAHVAHVAHKIRISQVDRLVEEAIARFMPAEAERRRRDAADGRHFNVNTRQPSLAGTTDVWGSLDAADALDLETAVAAGAETLKALGSTDSLDVRRAIALGQLARHEDVLPVVDEVDGPANPVVEDDPPSPVVEEVAQQPSRNHPTKPRQVVLYVHLSDAAITGGGGIGRFENTHTPITAEQIRAWCGTPDTHVVVKPVIDLNEHVHVDAYEVPDRLTEQARLIDHTCVFPWCTRPARKTTTDQHPADCDHITPRGRGGPTCSCNLAPLCRRHHRLKTHGAWTYTQPERGTYLWASPHGYHYLRNHHGTLDLSTDLTTGHPQQRLRRA